MSLDRELCFLPNVLSSKRKPGKISLPGETLAIPVPNFFPLGDVVELTFITTEACNLRCRYCYQKNFPSNFMPAELAIDSIRGAIAHGADSLALTFFGGEPLLAADTIFEVLTEARRLERETGVFITAKSPTNGVLLDESIIERAKELRLFLSLSFDGTREAQDAGRITETGESSFDQAQNALLQLVAARLPFAVYSVVTPHNVRWLAKSRQWLWDQGARILISALDYTADWDSNAIRELQQQYQKVGQFYRKILKAREDFHLEPFDSRIAQWTRASNWKTCSPGINSITVGPDGTFYGCVEYFYRRMNPIGHAKTWLSREALMTLSQDRSGQPAECISCGVQDRCNNTCACVNLRTTGSVKMPPESLCHTEQATILTVDDMAAKIFRDQVPGFLLKHYSQSYHMLSGIEALFESLEVDDEPLETHRV